MVLNQLVGLNPDWCPALRPGFLSPQTLMLVSLVSSGSCAGIRAPGEIKLFDLDLHNHSVDI